MNENLLEAEVEETDVSEVPAKFKDPETGELRVEALLKSYRELEKKLSGVAKAPESAEEYEVDCSHGLFEPDAELNAKFHAQGFTKEQVQVVYDAAAEKLVPMIASMAGEFQADREVERLVAEFGGVEQWEEMSRQLLAFGRKSLPEDVLDGLASSYEGVMALHKMMKGETPTLKTDTEGQTGLGEKELRSMMRDPKYWRDKDPSFISKVTDGFEKLY